MRARTLLQVKYTVRVRYHDDTIDLVHGRDSWIAHVIMMWAFQDQSPLLVQLATLVQYSTAKVGWMDVGVGVGSRYERGRAGFIIISFR